MQWSCQFTMLLFASSARFAHGITTTCESNKTQLNDEEELEESALLQVTKDVQADVKAHVKVYSQAKEHHIEVSGGVAKPLFGEAPKYLSSTESGDDVDLHAVDDGSGRQRWTFEKVPDEDYYHIKIAGGIEDNVFGSSRSYLSATSNADNVDLHYEDDGSGRQHWLIDETPGGYHIRIGKGAYDILDRYYSYLSATDEGKVDLHTHDDGSGRQVWKIDGGFALPKPVPPPPVDPYEGWCKTGIRNGKACCDAKCGQCGGKGCASIWKRSAGSCCVSTIIGSTPQCKDPNDSVCHFSYE